MSSMGLSSVHTAHEKSCVTMFGRQKCEPKTETENGERAGQGSKY